MTAGWPCPRYTGTGYDDPNIEVTHDAGVTWSALRLPAHQPAIADVLALELPTCMVRDASEWATLKTTLHKGHLPVRCQARCSCRIFH